MKLQILAACAALATLSAGQAFAGDAIVAKLSAPVAEKTKFIAGGANFCAVGNDTGLLVNATSALVKTFKG